MSTTEFGVGMRVKIDLSQKETLRYVELYCPDPGSNYETIATDFFIHGGTICSCGPKTCMVRAAHSAAMAAFYRKDLSLQTSKFRLMPFLKHDYEKWLIANWFGD